MEKHINLNPYTCFKGHQHIASGTLDKVALTVKRVTLNRAAGTVLVFDNNTGRSIDIDTRGSDEEVTARFTSITTNDEPVTTYDEVTEADAPKGRGRPKLGVVAREVTLLPRHWEWLATQPGSASVTLRKLVEQARRENKGHDKTRKAQERAYHFMLALAGDLPNYEEATRALFANDMAKFNALIAHWPVDVHEHATWLATTE